MRPELFHLLCRLHFGYLHIGFGVLLSRQQAKEPVADGFLENQLHEAFRDRLEDRKLLDCRHIHVGVVDELESLLAHRRQCVCRLLKVELPVFLVFKHVQQEPLRRRSALDYCYSSIAAIVVRGGVKS